MPRWSDDDAAHTCRVDTGWKYVFPRKRCATCALQARCLERLPKATGRMVVINDYTAEYVAARQKATTAAYRQVRREHPAIERKLAGWSASTMAAGRAIADGPGTASSIC